MHSVEKLSNMTVIEKGDNIDVTSELLSTFPKAERQQLVNHVLSILHTHGYKEISAEVEES